MDSVPKLLSREFFARETKIVAREALGKTLVRVTEQGFLYAKIVETEAYLGEHDPAAHAAFGCTKRTKILYGEAGHAYIFQLHGHCCLNFVAEPEGSPGCVLIRAVEPLDDSREVMQRLRNMPARVTDIANGPGKLCQAMVIGMTMYGVDLVDPHSPLQVWESLEARPQPMVETSCRIGLTKAADWELRFTIRGNPYCSSQRKKSVPLRLEEQTSLLPVGRTQKRS